MPSSSPAICSESPSSNEITIKEDNPASMVSADTDMTDEFDSAQNTEQQVTAEDEKRIIKNLEKEQPLVTGDLWYLIDIAWFKTWKAYTGYDPHFGVVNQQRARPGPIDNTPLLTYLPEKQKYKLKTSLFQSHNFDHVPEKAWEKLHQWYGGGPVIKRPVVQIGFTKRKKVEIYKMKVRVVHNANVSKEIERSVSRLKTIREFKEKTCRLLKIEPEKVKLFKYYLKMKSTEFVDLDASVDQIGDNSVVFFEEEGVETKTPSSPASGLYISPYNNNSNSRSMSYNCSTSPQSYLSSSSSIVKSKGLSGLRNLGSTCFMNSAVQCLSYAPPLTQYFVSGKYLEDINTTNPLGMKGRIAEEFGKLITHLWSGRQVVVDPSEFKTVLGKFAPQFDSMLQQDAQELLAFLLDGLHEDLNRVKDKQFIESNEKHKGKDDKEAATEAWEDHLKRNQSVIVDFFQGQYKSTLRCPHCSEISITFDPFMYLTLPLPEIKTMVRNIIVWRDFRSQPIRYGFKLKKTATISDLKKEISEKARINVNEIVIAEISSFIVGEIFDERKLLSEISESSATGKGLVAYVVGPPQEDTILIRVSAFSRVSKFNQKDYCYPFLIAARPSATVREIYALCWKKLSGVFTNDQENDDAIDFENIMNMFSLIQVGKPEQRLTDLDSVPNLMSRDSLYAECKAITHNKPLTPKDDVSCSIAEDAPILKTTLLNCLEAFTQEETLNPDDYWYCPTCKEFRAATKKMDLYRLPEVLVVHLKRFLFNQRIREKLDTFVDFPLRDLDLTKFVPPGQQNCQYDLFAISNHEGYLGGGHYTCFAKRQEDNQWYLFNDSYVTCVPESRLVSKFAYLLFYRRKSNKN